MTSESYRISEASCSYVGGVCRSWGWGWNDIGQADDDGLDGIIFLRTLHKNPKIPSDKRYWKHRFTGGVIYVQIKSGSSYLVAEDEHIIELKISDLAEKRDLWKRPDSGVSLVYVKSVGMGKIPSEAWWVDLKSEATYSSKNTILIPKRNRFQAGLECRKPFSRLASRHQILMNIPEIDMTKYPQSYDFSRSYKQVAWDFYRSWKQEGATNPTLGEVIINRTGWSHITRVGRPLSRIKASFDLLPAAARIVSEVANWKVLRRGISERLYPDNSKAEYEYLGLSAMVKWPSRAPSEVMVILRRQTIIADNASFNSMSNLRVISRRTWFYTVYEPGRGR